MSPGATLELEAAVGERRSLGSEDDARTAFPRSEDLEVTGHVQFGARSCEDHAVSTRGEVHGSPALNGHVDRPLDRFAIVGDAVAGSAISLHVHRSLEDQGVHTTVPEKGFGHCQGCETNGGLPEESSSQHPLQNRQQRPPL
jgi:hypothetical protein